MSMLFCLTSSNTAARSTCGSCLRNCRIIHCALVPYRFKPLKTGSRRMGAIKVLPPHSQRGPMPELPSTSLRTNRGRNRSDANFALPEASATAQPTQREMPTDTPSFFRSSVFKTAYPAMCSVFERPKSRLFDLWMRTHWLKQEVSSEDIDGCRPSALALDPRLSRDCCEPTVDLA